jgi:glycosyltransferase involved in cell wall biosynthesis
MEKTKSLAISVIIITLNRAEWLSETLSSLLDQSRRAEEVIVVDNGSTDHTKDIAESFKDKLNIKYIHEEKRGIPFARNAGIKYASKEIIAFIDDDCIAHKDWLKYIELTFLRDPNIGMVGGEVSYLKSSEAIVDKFYSKNMPSFFEEKK